MKLLPSVAYPENEIPKLAALERLFEDWHQHFTEHASALTKHAPGDLVFDGFYPHYFAQKIRILYVAREARGISGFNYIDALLPCYHEGKRIGKQHLNRSKFHSRLLQIAYGIINGMVEWHQIPRASEIGNTFGKENGLSFAFMNISKLSNDSEQWSSAWDVINVQHQLCNQARRFNEEQIAILQPQLVITMNLGARLASLGQLSEPLHQDGQTRAFRLNSHGHRSLLIDSWHFSAPRKKAKVDYYVPICSAVRAAINDLGAHPRIAQSAPNSM